MADKAYLEAILEASLDAITTYQAAIDKLKAVNQPPFPALAASMQDRLDELRRDVEKLRDELDGID